MPTTYFDSNEILLEKAQLSERALELLALPDDGVPKLLLDVGKVEILFF